MIGDIVLKILSSLPVILVCLYYFPFLGILFTLVRLYSYKETENKIVLIIFVVLGIIIYIPTLIRHILVSNDLGIDMIPKLKEILNSDIYCSLLDKAIYLIVVAIILLLGNIFFDKIKFVFKDLMKSSYKSDKNIYVTDKFNKKRKK